MAPFSTKRPACGRLAEPEQQAFKGETRQNQIKALPDCLGRLQQAGADRGADVSDSLPIGGQRL